MVYLVAKSPGTSWALVQTVIANRCDSQQKTCRGCLKSVASEDVRGAEMEESLSMVEGETGVQAMTDENMISIFSC